MHFKILLLQLTVVLYLCSPVDLIPEAVFGVLGLIDDLVVAILVAYTIAGVWRAHLLAGSLG